jgi:prepilin-type N-terminal cleavage/methylation domain-containing protein
VTQRRLQLRSRGFTLPEVLTAMLLAGIVLPVAIKGVSLALFASTDARHRIEAVALGETKLDELAASMTSSNGGDSEGDFGEKSPLFRWKSSTSSVETDLAEIRVRVSWTARGRERSVELTSFAYAGTNMTSTTSPPAPGGTP